MTSGSLFAGIGGFDLGFERAGIRTIWQVECDPYCRKILRRQFPHARQIIDVRDCYRFAGEYPECDCCGEPFCERHNQHFANCPCIGCSEWDDEIPYVDIISGGFPCEDISKIGRQAGIVDGEQSALWSEMCRIVCALRPRFVVVENVPNLLQRDIGRVLADLAESGYDAEWDCLPASTFGARHQRDRLFIVGYTEFPGLEGHAGNVIHSEGRAHSSGPARETGIRDGEKERLAAAWITEPDVGRVADGVPHRVDRLEALGNAVVPQVAEWLGRRILEVAA